MIVQTYPFGMSLVTYLGEQGEGLTEGLVHHCRTKKPGGEASMCKKRSEPPTCEFIHANLLIPAQEVELYSDFVDIPLHPI